MSRVAAIKPLRAAYALALMSCAVGDGYNIDDSETSDQYESDAAGSQIDSASMTHDDIDKIIVTGHNIAPNESNDAADEFGSDPTADFYINDNYESLGSPDSSEEATAKPGELAELADPSLLLTFALYGNVGKSGNRSDVDVPYPLKTGPWTSVNTLGFDSYGHGFSVRKYVPTKDTKSHWWNENGRYYWAYEDVGADHNHGKEDYQIREAINGSQSKIGYVYIAFQNGNRPEAHFVNPNSIHLPEGSASYFFEVYDGPSYDAWKRLYSADSSYTPMFNITRLANRRDKANCAGKAFDSAPTQNSVLDMIHRSAIYRYKTRRIPVVNMAFYSGCYIQAADAEVLADQLTVLYKDLKDLQHRGGDLGRTAPRRRLAALRPDKAHNSSASISNNFAASRGSEHQRPTLGISSNHAASRDTERQKSSNHSLSSGNEHRQSAPAIANKRAVTAANEHRQPEPAIAGNHKAVSANEHQQSAPLDSQSHESTPSDAHRQSTPRISNERAATERRQPTHGSPSDTKASRANEPAHANDHQQTAPSKPNNRDVAPANEHQQATPSKPDNRGIAPTNEHRQSNPRPAPSHATRGGHG